MPDLTAADFGFTTAFLKQHPDVKGVVDQAIANEWSTTRTIAAIKTTKWWKSKTDAQRRYDLMRAENPAELQRLRTQARTTVATMGARMGATLSQAWINNLAEKVVQSGLTEDEIKHAIGAAWSFGTGRTGQGQVVDREIREMASNYGLRVSPTTIRTWTRQVLQGHLDLEAYKNHLQVAAERQFPTIAEALRSGFTTRQIMEPYIEYAASELGVNPQTIDPSSAKWNKVLSYRGVGGKEDARVMSLDEWVRTIRTDKSYGWDKTATAQRQGAILAGQIASAMGSMR